MGTLMLSKESKSSIESPLKILMNLTKELDETKKQLEDEVKKKEFLQRHVKEFASKSAFLANSLGDLENMPIQREANVPMEPQGYELAINTLSKATDGPHSAILKQNSQFVENSLQIKPERYFFQPEYSISSIHKTTNQSITQ